MPDSTATSIHDLTHYCRGVYGIWDTEAWGPQNPWAGTCSCGGWRGRFETEDELLTEFKQHAPAAAAHPLVDQ